MLSVQQFLRTKGDPSNPSAGCDKLKSKYGIAWKRHPKYPNLVLFKYDQIDSPMASDIVQDCRGIILDSNDDWKVVAMSFRRFFNYREGAAAEIDWETANVQEKVDGSLCVMYAYDGEWHVATSGLPDAGGKVNGNPMTFADYFWETFDKAGMQRPGLDCGMCFFFELSGPLNRVVVQQTDSKLTVLGCRILRTLEEQSAQKAAEILKSPSSAVQSYPLQSVDDLLATFARINPLQQEGYVVVDARWNRLKVKHPGYVALHHAGTLDRLTPPALVDIVRRMEGPEVVAASPDLRSVLDDAAGRLDALVAAIEADYARLRGTKGDKEFAQQAKQTRYADVLFLLRRGDVTTRATLAKMRLETLVAMLGYEPAMPEAAAADEKVKPGKASKADKKAKPAKAK